MRLSNRKRPRSVNRTVAAAAALVLGGGGVAVVAANASAGGSKQDTGAPQTVSSTIDCPDVGDRLRDVPKRSRPVVDRNLAQLDAQVAEAYKKLTSGGTGRTKILSGLKEHRGATIRRISDAIAQQSGSPAALGRMSGCKYKPDGSGVQVKDGGGQGDQQGQDGQGDQNVQGGQDSQGDQQGQDGQGDQQGQGDGQGGQGNGPVQDDFVDITSVQPNVDAPDEGGDASTGTFTSECGVNENGHFNPDNVIVAPGVSNGAHHMHDYVGNESTDAFSTDESLAAADTTCTNGDQSTHYWPVVRLRDNGDEKDVNAPGGGQDGNVGKILQPADAEITLSGSQAGEVTGMPRFLRIITGDAKAFTNGDANANASWSCTGFEDRQLTDKYPICPEGSKVVRSLKFQSCWDGQNIDSANHRTHVAFAQQDGSCGNGFKAIPQLTQKITYDIPAGDLFAVDSFPEQLHKPVTDHGDFINVMSDDLMNEAVGCINSGEDCG
ncbi:DUF1996 domain-containing protein [Streptomyces sp. H27-D2]|uniref:DUF1996 domain-containing protein n=1 Tax=Streptomyces sp. H27-D2 TaxID=3046304 RepID=UPI002DBCA178|nr:DUF1996 domain-containing protein [Streptomyces sp. H27-D2]MEC4019575.1 DUF1996 domain-containing protein [Streptomyces sp. H27-D2]